MSRLASFDMEWPFLQKQLKQFLVVNYFRIKNVIVDVSKSPKCAPASIETQALVHFQCSKKYYEDLSNSN